MQPGASPTSKRTFPGARTSHGVDSLQFSLSWASPTSIKMLVFPFRHQRHVWFCTLSTSVYPAFRCTARRLPRNPNFKALNHAPRADYLETLISKPQILCRCVSEAAIVASVPEDSVWGDVYAASLVVWRSVYDECVGISCLDTDDGCRAKTLNPKP
jgi:hypothetical protein